MAILNGVFEASKTGNFSDSVILHTFINVPVRSGQIITIPVQGDYQHIRWKSKLTGYCTAAGITLYTTDDQAMLTSFSSVTRDDSRSSVKFPYPKDITKIRYNVLSKYSNDSKNSNLEYELYCYAKDGWKSLGKQTEKNDTLFYKAPSKALFYLRNVTLDKTSAMFCIQDGKPKFL
jgi:hypothetical protein